MTKKRYDPNTPIYQLMMTLLDIDPPVWRQFQVRENVTLSGLHDYLQGVMLGWADYHLHEFEIGGHRYGIPDPEYDDVPEMRLNNENRFKLGQLTKPGDVFLYRYDFGDDWVHEIVVEEKLSPEPGVKYPICLAGQRRCPPEDCGGPGGV